jgi:hypothetical protein
VWVPHGDAAGAAAGAGDQRVPRLHASLHPRGAGRLARHRLHRVCISGERPYLFKVTARHAIHLQLDLLPTLIPLSGVGTTCFSS